MYCTCIYMYACAGVALISKEYYTHNLSSTLQCTCTVPGFIHVHTWTQVDHNCHCFCTVHCATQIERKLFYATDCTCTRACTVIVLVVLLSCDTCLIIHRVSVPRSSVQAPYQLRPHRRRSFDPSDSMALNRVYTHTHTHTHTHTNTHT